MKKITLFITVLACLLSLSCTRQKTSGNDTFCHSCVESTTDSVASCAGAVANIPQKMIGTYTDINDGSTLEIGNSTNSGLSVKINLFRLTDIDDGIGLISDGVLIFNATDAAGNPIKGKITLDSDTATLVFTESTWEYLPNGTSYSFIRGAETDYGPANPIGGRTYSGVGNGGGLATSVTIEFDKTGTCQCTSDFYQAFTEPVTANGTYSIRYDIVEVRCRPDGFDSPIVWNFEIIDDGQELSFNNYDSSEEGSLGTDWLQLKMK